MKSGYFKIGIFALVALVVITIVIIFVGRDETSMDEVEAFVKDPPASSDPEPTSEHLEGDQESGEVEAEDWPYVVTRTEMKEDLEAAAAKILDKELGLKLPESARNFRKPRPGSFQLDVEDAKLLIEEITKALSDKGTYTGWMDFNYHKWELVAIGMGNDPLRFKGVGYEESSYMRFSFVPKGKTLPYGVPVYHIFINPNNGFVNIMITFYD
ncbi:hypothetical protein OAF27_01895 [Verrucomicrobiales bacterium]|nr:hypothetical protein [Verrucomicrobiales bacterium]